MKCLLDRLLSCKPSDVLWVADPVGQVDITRLNRALGSGDPMGWQGKRVAIGVLPVIEFICTLTFLDGLAQAIVLLPTEDDQPTREARLAQAGIDIVVEGNGFGFAKLLANFDAIDASDNAQPVGTARPPAIRSSRPLLWWRRDQHWNSEGRPPARPDGQPARHQPLARRNRGSQPQSPARPAPV